MSEFCVDWYIKPDHIPPPQPKPEKEKGSIKVVQK